MNSKCPAIGFKRHIDQYSTEYFGVIFGLFSAACGKLGLQFDGKVLETNDNLTIELCYILCRSTDECNGWTFKLTSKQCVMYNRFGKIIGNNYAPIKIAHLNALDQISGPNECSTMKKVYGLEGE